jgi:hypothetical protein
MSDAKLAELCKSLPFNPNHHKICVLTIHPLIDCKPHDSPVSCSLQTVTMSADYNALSYIWGNPRDTRPIVVNGVKLHVTRNLASALCHIRSLYIPPCVKVEAPDLSLQLPIWADAVCINQQEAREQAQRVSIMGSLYLYAIRVLIWLGEGKPCFEFVFRELYNGVRNGCECWRLDSYGLLRWQYTWLCSLGMFNDYWTRRWVLQEVALARREPVIVCGRWIITWQVALQIWGRELHACVMYDMSAKEWMEDNGRRMRPNPEVDEGILGLVFRDLGMDGSEGDDAESGKAMSGVALNFEFARQQMAKEGGFDNFIDGLSLAFAARASKPHDHVFALRALLKEKARDQIRVDYDQQPQELFQAVMASQWKRNADCTARLLHLLDFHIESSSDASPRPSQRVEGLSWVPDFSQQKIAWRACNTISALWVPSTWRSVEVWLADKDTTLCMRGVELAKAFRTNYSPNVAGFRDFVCYAKKLWETQNYVADAVAPDVQLLDWAREKASEWWKSTHKDPMPLLKKLPSTWVYTRQPFTMDLEGKKMFGAGPLDTRDGDTVLFFYGTRFPLILRAEKKRYKMIGQLSLDH